MTRYNAQLVGWSLLRRVISSLGSTTQCDAAALLPDGHAELTCWDSRVVILLKFVCTFIWDTRLAIIPLLLMMLMSVRLWWSGHGILCRITGARTYLHLVDWLATTVRVTDRNFRKKTCWTSVCAERRALLTNREWVKFRASVI